MSASGGIRENGGQYTQAAIWSVLAFAMQGDGDRAAELFSILNPIQHASMRAAVHRYKVEPYVACTDVYSEPPHVGRGGWSWYNGSAGWMYRLVVESLLGLRLDLDRLHVAPCLPAHWDGLTIHYRYRETVYHIAIVHTRDGAERDATGITVDGVEQAGQAITLVDDHKEHAVAVTVNAK